MISPMLFWRCRIEAGALATAASARRSWALENEGA